MSLRVLIVDDSPLIHNMLKKVLVSNGHSICGDARNGKEGLELFQKEKPDVVFMDINMPIMDGITSASEIKKLDPMANVIMLTAVGDEKTHEKVKSFGVDIMLKKPFNDYTIISALSKV
jgi:two-component system, chemotaxis family, chemotaxis protein CheY